MKTTTFFQRMVALTCVLAITFTLSQSFAFATEVEDNFINKVVSVNDVYDTADFDASAVDLEKIDVELQVLERLGILVDSKQLQKITLTESGVYAYQVQLGSYINILQVNCEEEGKTVLTAKQGNIYNELVLNDDGTIFLDGKEVVIPHVNRQERVGVNGQTYWTYAPEYGTPGAYSHPFSTEQNVDVSMPNSFANLALSVFTGIMVSIFIPGGVGVALGAITSLSNGIYTEFVAKDPTSNCMSYKASIYTTKANSGYVDKVYGYCYRYDFTFYSEKNFTHYTYKDTLYKRIQTY